MPELVIRAWIDDSITKPWQDAVRANLEQENKMLKDEIARLKQQLQFNQG
jgi:hypothetical protein